MKPALAAISIALTLALSVACGQEPVPTPTPTSAPTETPTPIPPTNTPVAGPVAASNIPMPTRAPIIAPTPAPTSTPRPTRTPVSLEFAILDSSREFTSKAGGGYAFNMSGVLSVRTSAGQRYRHPAHLCRRRAAGLQLRQNISGRALRDCRIRHDNPPEHRRGVR